MVVVACVEEDGALGASPGQCGACWPTARALPPFPMTKCCPFAWSQFAQARHMPCPGIAGPGSSAQI